MKIKYPYIQIIYRAFDLAPPLVHNMRICLRCLATFTAQNLLNISRLNHFSNKCVAKQCGRVCTVAYKLIIE
jgi:hypothetical protein